MIGTLVPLPVDDREALPSPTRKPHIGPRIVRMKSVRTPRRPLSDSRMFPHDRRSGECATGCQADCASQKIAVGEGVKRIGRIDLAMVHSSRQRSEFGFSVKTIGKKIENRFCRGRDEEVSGSEKNSKS